MPAENDKKSSASHFLNKLVPTTARQAGCPALIYLFFWEYNRQPNAVDNRNPLDYK